MRPIESKKKKQSNPSIGMSQRIKYDTENSRRKISDKNS